MTTQDGGADDWVELITGDPNSKVVSNNVTILDGAVNDTSRHGENLYCNIHTSRPKDLRHLRQSMEHEHTVTYSVTQLQLKLLSLADLNNNNSKENNTIIIHHYTIAKMVCLTLLWF